MPNTIRCVLGLVALFTACQHADATDRERPRRAMLDPTAALLDPIQVDSLTLTPIVAPMTPIPIEEPDVLTLDEGFALKVVGITEQVGGSAVNSLTLTNKDQRPLFLLAGEVIIGGRQDRIIGQNTVVPGNTTTTVPVFCVEHGRWGGSTDVFTSGKALAHGRLRGKASFDTQQAVWNEVSEMNAERKTSNATGTYRDVATTQSDGTLTASESRVNAALAKIDPGERARMIGYVIALNGKVATVDRFTSPRLFHKLEGKLVRSYLTESIDVVAAKNIVAPAATDVKAFMADPDKAAEEQSYENAASSTARKMGAKAAKAQVELKFYETKGGMRGKGGKLYETYQAK